MINQVQVAVLNASKEKIESHPLVELRVTPVHLIYLSSSSRNTATCNVSGLETAEYNTIQ